MNKNINDIFVKTKLDTVSELGMTDFTDMFNESNNQIDIRRNARHNKSNMVNSLTSDDYLSQLGGNNHSDTSIDNYSMMDGGGYAVMNMQNDTDTAATLQGARELVSTLPHESRKLLQLLQANNETPDETPVTKEIDHHVANIASSYEELLSYCNKNQLRDDENNDNKKSHMSDNKLQAYALTSLNKVLNKKFNIHLYDGNNDMLNGGTGNEDDNDNHTIDGGNDGNNLNDILDMLTDYTNDNIIGGDKRHNKSAKVSSKTDSITSKLALRGTRSYNK